MRRLIVLLSVLALLLVTAAPAAALGQPFVVRMSGTEEVPGPGDPDGMGLAIVTVDPERGQVCFVLAVRRIGLPATAAHIHPGQAGQANPPIIHLVAPGHHGLSAGCTEASSELLQNIRNQPWAYYVNVHNQEYPGGAVRGQLSTQSVAT